jgi:hypothetical protein
MQSFFVEKRGKAERKKKEAKKKETDGHWETGAADGNPPRIPTAAWKAKTAFHSSHEAQQKFDHPMYFFERQRSTLHRRTFGPKNREHFIDDPKVYNVTQVIGAEYAAAQKRTRDLLWEARRSVF